MLILIVVIFSDLIGPLQCAKHFRDFRVDLWRLISGNSMLLSIQYFTVKLLRGYRTNNTLRTPEKFKDFDHPSIYFNAIN